MRATLRLLDSGRGIMRRLIIRVLRSLRLPTLIVLDSSAWFIAMLLAVALRLDDWKIVLLPGMDGSKGHIPLYGVAIVAGVAAIAAHSPGLATAASPGTVAARRLRGDLRPCSIVVGVGVIVGTLNIIGSGALRSRARHRSSPQSSPSCLLPGPAGCGEFWWPTPKPNRFGVVSEPVLVIGAGEGGCQLVDSMIRDPKQHWRPIGFARRRQAQATLPSPGRQGAWSHRRLRTDHSSARECRERGRGHPER